MERLREGARLTSGASPHYAPYDDEALPVIWANGRIESTDQANATRGAEPKEQRLGEFDNRGGPLNPLGAPVVTRGVDGFDGCASSMG